MPGLRAANHVTYYALTGCKLSVHGSHALQDFVCCATKATKRRLTMKRAIGLVSGMTDIGRPTVQIADEGAWCIDKD